MSSIGNFSVSLAVQDIHKSREFYEKLGFEAVGGNIKQNWLIMQNDDCTIGLFQGMFEKNILTFNPGWSREGEEIDEFTDVRVLQEQLRSKGSSFYRRPTSTPVGPRIL